MRIRTVTSLLLTTARTLTVKPVSPAFNPATLSPSIPFRFASNMADKNDKNDKGITGWAGKDGEFKRQVSSFRDHIEPNGRFPPEKGE